MEYKRFGNEIVARMDVGDEIIEQVGIITEREGIKLAQINALGAIGEFTVGAYNVAEQKYYKSDYTGAWEVVSLHGNITQMDGKPYFHLHLAASDEEGRTVGGHLNRAVICGTCEMFISVVDGEVGRIKDDCTGLNVFKF